MIGPENRDCLKNEDNPGNEDDLKIQDKPKNEDGPKMKKILKGKMTLNLDTNEWQLAGGTVKGYFSPWAQQYIRVRAYLVTMEAGDRAYKFIIYISIFCDEPETFHFSIKRQSLMKNISIFPSSWPLLAKFYCNLHTIITFCPCHLYIFRDR